MNDADLKKARFYALKVLNFRPRSAEELSGRMREKGFAEELIREVLTEFAKKGLIDDKKFSKLWVESRMAARPKGGALLRRELREKGVKEEVVEQILGEVRKEYNEYEIVKQLARDRMRLLSGLDKATVKRRLFGFLKRRGFEFDTIMRVLNETVTNEN